jgi:hypothetical protein
MGSEQNSRDVDASFGNWTWRNYPGWWFSLEWFPVLVSVRSTVISIKWQDYHQYDPAKVKEVLAHTEKSDSMIQEMTNRINPRVLREILLLEKPELNQEQQAMISVFAGSVISRRLFSGCDLPIGYLWN